MIFSKQETPARLYPKKSWYKRNEESIRILSYMLISMGFIIFIATFVAMVGK